MIRESLIRIASIRLLLDGCTHLLVLRAHPVGRKAGEFEVSIDRDVVARHLAKFNRDLAWKFLQAQFNEKVNGLAKLAQSEERPKAAPFLFSIQPVRGSIDLEDWECDRDQLLLGAWSGAEAALSILNPPEEAAQKVYFAFAALDGKRAR